jgi:hypothetical protein
MLFNNGVQQMALQQLLLFAGVAFALLWFWQIFNTALKGSYSATIRGGAAATGT